MGYGHVIPMETMCGGASPTRRISNHKETE
jgi:hypothetical protein